MCTVLLDGVAVNACILLAVRCRGHAIVTIEGLAAGDELDPLQRAFIDHGAVQCGYCIPGMILTARAYLDEHPTPNEAEVRAALAGKKPPAEALKAADERWRALEPAGRRRTEYAYSLGLTPP